MIQFRQKFFVDAMLGNIAKKLRLLGYDAIYSSTISDTEILSIIQKEKRILITKDYSLTKKAQKQKLDVIFLKGNDELTQFHSIKKQLGIKKFFLDAKTSRCTICNGELRKIPKLLVSDNIPSRILDYTNDYWRCSQCSKVYWHGTHIINLQNFVGRLNEK